MIRFDAYTATSTEGKLHHFLPILEALEPRGELKQSRGQNFFSEKVALIHEGHEIGSISWGGRNEGLTMMEVKGEHTPAAVEAIRASIPHRCTRVDSCADFDRPNVFDELVAQITVIKKKHGIKGSKAGDWEDHPDEGRTFYVGAPSSSVLCRTYEKGKQPEYRHLNRPHWTRSEVQARPKREARDLYALESTTPESVWGAARFTRDIAAVILQNHVDPHPAGTIYRLPSDERALRWVSKQYGPLFLRLFEDLGSWQAVGLTLGDYIEQARK